MWVMAKKSHKAKKSPIKKAHMAKKLTKALWVRVSPWVSFLNMKNILLFFKYIIKLSI